MFIGEAGNDRIGETVRQYLVDNGVDASNLNVFPNSKSPISLAFLNDSNNADYLFYKDHPHDQIDFVYPDINPEDIILFGSFFAVNPVVRPQVMGFLDYARSHGAIIYYDVNYRSSHSHEVMKVTPNILENFEFADEDFEVMFKKKDADSVYRSEISFYTKNFLYTRGKEPVELRGQGGLAKQYPVPPTETVSTIGAGDNFNAGFVYGLIKYGITRSMIEAGLSEAQWDSIIDCAQQFSANVCKSISNSVDKAFGEKMKRELNTK